MWFTKIVKFQKESRQLLDSVRGATLTEDERCSKAVALAEILGKEAKRVETKEEKQRFAELNSMMEDAGGKDFTVDMTDQCFRSTSNRRIADQMGFLIQKYGVPQFLDWKKQKELTFFKWFPKFIASLFVPLTQRIIKKQTQEVILTGGFPEIAKHIRSWTKEDVRINLNHLGEAVLSEDESLRRLEIYKHDLASGAVEYVSVKVSTLYSQINLIAWDESIEILAERLRELYRAAALQPFIRKDGKAVPKFVNLDMEEYRDLHLTVELFCKVLSEPEFVSHSAGIVLQSYLPDSFAIQKQLTKWAMNRVVNGGAPIKIRLVKGANLGMEKVESSIRGWPQAPYLSKIEVDANFKKMAEYGCIPDHAKAVHLGIGSHNLFDIAYVFVLRAENEVEPFVSFEMLEGMADPLARVVQKLSGGMLLYCPATKEEDFENAVSYLMRRLDENTAPENFLRYLFDMTPGSPQWNLQQELFVQACAFKAAVTNVPRRTQNRQRQPQRPFPTPGFINEPDTDFSLPENRKWAQQILEKGIDARFEPVPLVIDGKTISRAIAIGTDPSRPRHELFKYTQANESEIELALSSAKKASEQWGRTSVYDRAEFLEEVAHNIRRRRGELIAAMVAESGKTVDQADVEISEAIDFADYYRRSLLEWSNFEDITWKPMGVALVTPPWNFPLSIPCGSVLAALATGNSVLFKPAPEATLVGWLLAKILWESGVDKKVLQFIPCKDDPEGSKLIQDPRVDLVILTGATETAQMFMKMRPGLHLVAETGGKNGLIVTAMADRDQAVKDIIQSAFGYSGQKCSACSLAILEAEVYNSPKFRRQLIEAASSLKVGSAWDPTTKINPLRSEANPKLLRGLTQLEEGEEWLLQPKQDAANPQLWSPGIKIGVRPGSFTHTTELFGPVLGIMRAKNLEHAIELVNQTPFGLTSGINTLDDREKKLWASKIQAGNCYINRGITGAVVFRQPFGGHKASSFGPGAKAGGPNYLTQMMKPTQNGLPKERDNYVYWWDQYFSKPHNLAALIGQDNLFLYRPRQTLLFRVQDSDSAEDVLQVVAAAATCGTPLYISSSKELPLPNVVVEDEASFIEKMKQGSHRRIRMLSQPSQHLLEALADASVTLHLAPVLANGRLELLHYLDEVSVSHDYHRYGNISTHNNIY